MTAPPSYHHSDPTAPPSKPRRWPWIIGIVTALVIGFAMGSAGGGSETAASPSPSIVAPQPYQGSVPQVAPTAEPVAEGITDGTYEVGTDIQPGKYKTAGPDESSVVGCYYSRMKTGDGSLGDIIDNNITRGPSTVTIKPTDGMFETNGCQPWTKVG